MKSDTGESTASIQRRMDDEAWPGVEAELRTGATLLKMTHGVNRFAIQDRAGDIHGPTISATRVRKLEKDRVLRFVGVDRYGLVEMDHPRTRAVLGAD